MQGLGLLMNRERLSQQMVGAPVRLIGKKAGIDGNILKVVAPDGHEVMCRLNSFAKPQGTGLVVQISGTLESDLATISLTAPVIEIPGDVDLPLLNEAVSLQFAKPFSHIFAQ